MIAQETVTIQVQPRALQEEFDADGIRARLRALREPAVHGAMVLAGACLLLALGAVATLAVAAVGH